MASEKEIMGVAEAARYLCLSKPLIYRLVREGTIPHVRIPGIRRLIFIKDDLRKWVEGYVDTPWMTVRGVRQKSVRRKQA